MGRGVIGPFGRGVALVYDSRLVTGTLPTFTFPSKNAFTKLSYYLYYGAGGQPTTMKLTGLTAVSYDERLLYTLRASPTVTSTISNAAAASWLSGGLSAGGATVTGDIWLPPAPEIKYHSSSNDDSTAWRFLHGSSTDVTNDPTALAFVLSASIQYRLRVWGWP